MEIDARMGRWLRNRLALVTRPQLAGLLVPVVAGLDVAEATVERVSLLMAGGEISA